MKFDKLSHYLPIWIAVASLLYYLTYFNYGLTMNDEGLLVDSVMRVLDGQLPLRDFYSYAPARYFYLAGWFQLLGTNLLTERFAFIAVRVLTPAFLFVIARRFLPTYIALIPSMMIALVAGPWEKTVDTLIPIFNVWLILCYLERPSSLRLILAGLVAGLSWMWKQDAGSLAILAGSVCLILLNKPSIAGFGQRSVWMERTRQWLIYLAGVWLGIFPFIIYYSTHNALADLFLGQFTAVRVYQTIGVSFPSPLLILNLSYPGRALEVSLVYTYLFILVSFPFAFWFTRQKQATVASFLLALWVFGCAASPNIFIYPAFSRLTQTGPLAYILGAIEIVWALEIVKERWKLAPNLMRGLSGICLLIPLAFLTFGLTDNNMYVGSIGIRLGRNTPLGLERAPIYESAANVTAIKEVVNWVQRQTTPDESIFASYDYFFYFLSARNNPTGVYFNLPLLAVDPELQTQIISDLESHRPKLLIRRVNENPRADVDSLWWDEYVREHYQLEYQNHAYLLYQRTR